MVIICTIRNVINLNLDAAESTFITWATDINGVHHFVLQKFGDILYSVHICPLFFARPLIYKNSISVLFFLHCKGSVNGFGWHMVSAVQFIYL